MTADSDYCTNKLWASAGGGQNGHLAPLGIGSKNQNF